MRKEPKAAITDATHHSTSSQLTCVQTAPGQPTHPAPHLNFLLLLLLLLQYAIISCLVGVSRQHITSRGPLLPQTLPDITATGQQFASRSMAAGSAHNDYHSTAERKHRGWRQGAFLSVNDKLPCICSNTTCCR
jgi:hypothetical protein